MRLDSLARQIGAEIVAAPAAAAPGIDRVYAGDRISDLLNHATESTLIVSNLSGSQLAQLAHLMDVPGLCLVNGIVPEPELIEAARRHQTLLMVSPLGMFETCGRLYAALAQERPAT